MNEYFSCWNPQAAKIKSDNNVLFWQHSKKVVRKFARGHNSFQDASRGDRPFTLVTLTLAVTEAAVIADGHKTVEDLSIEISISEGPIHNNLFHHLHMSKIYQDRCQDLSAEMMQARLWISQQYSFKYFQETFYKHLLYYMII